MPSFLPTPSNVTYLRGEEAVLPCAIRNRGTRTVVDGKEEAVYVSSPCPVHASTVLEASLSVVIYKITRSDMNC
ncbi:hypothetical protein ACOMHN_067293 [Nucella lapillus]